MIKKNKAPTCPIDQHCFCEETVEERYGDPVFRTVPAHRVCCNCGHKKLK